VKWPFETGFRPYLKSLFERYPTVSPQELDEATAIVKKEELLGEWEQDAKQFDFPSLLLHFTMWLLVTFVSILVLLSSLILPGGVLMRVVGLAVVTKDGKEVRRWRSVVRAFVAWSPGIAWLVLLPLSGGLLGPDQPTRVAVAFLSLLVFGAIWALAVPTRGFHDRLVGTWIVPR
jgi:hypothetical protein